MMCVELHIRINSKRTSVASVIIRIIHFTVSVQDFACGDADIGFELHERAAYLACEFDFVETYTVVTVKVTLQERYRSCIHAVYGNCIEHCGFISLS